MLGYLVEVAMRWGCLGVVEGNCTDMLNSAVSRATVVGVVGGCYDRRFYVDKIL